ncbi:MAG: hypothetical protein KAV87_57820 [Desulfobacteraceae bacterium]|nr:hypothetical protein [Desulfobacteraceae bacterium]
MALYKKINGQLVLVNERGEGLGVGGERQGDGGADVCVCPECNKEYPHEKGVPCNERKCPVCGVALVGESKVNSTKDELKAIVKVMGVEWSDLSPQPTSYEELARQLKMTVEDLLKYQLK